MAFVLPDWLTADRPPSDPPGIVMMRGQSQGVPVHIYGLVDPDSGLIRYIGKSIRPEGRLQNHMNEVSNCHRSHWLQSLKRRGLVPGLVILETIHGAWPWQEAERFWIAHGRQQGWPLTNNTSGGDGVPDLPAETRDRMSAVWRGRKHKPETLEKLRASRAGFRHSEETKAKMSEARTGRVITWGAKISDATYKLTAPEAEAVRQRLLSGEKVCDLAAELGLHRTTVSKIKMGRYRGKPE